MEMRDVERMERLHFEVICAASDTAGRTVAETMDELVRNSSRCITAARSAIRERDELRAQIQGLQQLASQRIRMVVQLPANDAA